MRQRPRTDVSGASAPSAGAGRSRIARAPLLVVALALLASCGGGAVPPTSAVPGGPSTAPGGSAVAPSSGVTPRPIATTTATGSATVTSTPPPSPTARPPFAMASSAFADGAGVPARYTCSGVDASPPLSWRDAPAGTVAYALLVVDPDAAGWVHWVAVDIPADRASLAAGIPVGVQGRNSFGGVGYRGPCPPVGSGTHHYVFTLYALSKRLGLSGVPTAAAVRAAAAHVTLGTTHLTGTFRR
ncbi:MAG: YbhB/YbcL family Raf kinase inhibitor-like protein [Candidatus Limnocylindrales bacterium]